MMKKFIIVECTCINDGATLMLTLCPYCNTLAKNVTS